MVLAAGLVGAASCGGDPGPGLSPPGTPLTAGLVVPVGAQLVGPVFARPPVQTARARALTPVTSDVAVLQIDGDPFAAWDDLAGQAQDLGVPMPGSGVCLWRVTGEGDQTPVGLPLRTDADALDCDAFARGATTDGTQVTVQAGLWWAAAGAELHVEISQGGSGDAAQSRGPVGPRAPARAGERLPERDPQTSVEAGDPFGRENNCFETGYDRLTLPDGARLVGGGTMPGLYDFAAVLAVEDAEAVLEELRGQLDDPGDSGGYYDLSEERLGDGASVWVLSGSVSAGGGGCDMWSSPDGKAILVTTSSD